MKFNFIHSVLFNLSINIEYVMLFYQIIMCGLLYSLRKPSKGKRSLLLAVFSLMIVTPLSTFFSNDIICSKIFEKEKNQCLFTYRTKNQKDFLVIKFSDNFKNEHNGYNVIDKKLGYFKSKDVFEVIISKEDVKFQVFNSDLLEELFYRKDKISKMRDDYFKSKKKEAPL